MCRNSRGKAQTHRMGPPPHRFSDIFISPWGAVGLVLVCTRRLNMGFPLDKDAVGTQLRGPVNVDLQRLSPVGQARTLMSTFRILVPLRSYLCGAEVFLKNAFPRWEAQAPSSMLGKASPLRRSLMSQAIEFLCFSCHHGDR